MLTYEEEKADFLAHYGVKGMKWGRRRASQEPSKESKLTEEQKTKQKAVLKKIAIGALVTGVIVGTTIAVYEGKKLSDAKKVIKSYEGLRGAGFKYLKDMPEETITRGQEFIRRSYEKETSIMGRAYAMVGNKATPFQEMFGNNEMKFEAVKDLKFAGGKAQVNAIKSLGLANDAKLEAAKKATERTIFAKRYIEKYGDEIIASSFTDENIATLFKGSDATKYLNYLKEAGYAGIQDPNYLDRPAKILFDSSAFLLKPQNY